MLLRQRKIRSVYPAVAFARGDIVNIGAAAHKLGTLLVHIGRDASEAELDVAHIKKAGKLHIEARKVAKLLNEYRAVLDLLKLFPALVADGGYFLQKLV